LPPARQLSAKPSLKHAAALPFFRCEKKPRSGIMPPINLGPALPIGAVPASTIRSGSNGRSEKAASPAQSQTSVVSRSDALDPGAPPVDTDRVAIVRKALEAGTYPVVPARVADAIIAAGLLLRSGK
jgi:negative regulator of flagellin synthesis FlgM